MVAACACDDLLKARRPVMQVWSEFCMCWTTDAQGPIPQGATEGVGS